jgi:hypothetical protein
LVQNIRLAGNTGTRDPANARLAQAKIAGREPRAIPQQ